MVLLGVTCNAFIPHPRKLFDVLLCCGITLSQYFQSHPILVLDSKDGDSKLYLTHWPVLGPSHIISLPACFIFLWASSLGHLLSKQVVLLKKPQINYTPWKQPTLTPRDSWTQKPHWLRQIESYFSFMSYLIGMRAVSGWRQGVSTPLWGNSCLL
jgi:hypothetical protein